MGHPPLGIRSLTQIIGYLDVAQKIGDQFFKNLFLFLLDHQVLKVNNFEVPISCKGREIDDILTPPVTIEPDLGTNHPKLGVSLTEKGL